MEYMLTTLDNPFNPHTHYAEWYQYDEEHNYHTCAYLARIAKTSDELSDTDELIAIEDAMNEIVSLNLLGIYIKVREDFIPRMVDIKE